MNIMVARNRVTSGDRPVETYGSSMVRVLRSKGHEVVDVPKSTTRNYDGVDLLIDIDCGRNPKGELIWQAQNGSVPVPSAVVFIDTHGYPAVHSRLAPHYDHVFFAVHDKRDLFANHPSAHWLPNFTDKMWFDGTRYDRPDAKDGFDFGFLGSKGGLDRADRMVRIASQNGWTSIARQVSAGHKHRWPSTPEIMSRCRNLFNHGQKHDGPNLRVMESMLMARPLITDRDPRSGMDLLFTSGTHYVPYEAYSYEGLKESMKWVMDNPQKAADIASNAYMEVSRRHLVEHRIDQILEVVR
jgi:hypothetical protein